MRLLLDEQMSDVAARSLAPLAETLGAAAVDHIRTIGHGGMDDDDIPALCREREYRALISLNVKDFGARRHYYAALVDAGVHVGVVRPARLKMTPANQVHVLSLHLEHMIRTWAAAEAPILIKITPSPIEPVSLDELVAQMDERHLP